MYNLTDSQWRRISKGRCPDNYLIYLEDTPSFIKKEMKYRISGIKIDGVKNTIGFRSLANLREYLEEEISELAEYGSEKNQYFTQKDWKRIFNWANKNFEKNGQKKIDFGAIYDTMAEEIDEEIGELNAKKYEIRENIKKLLKGIR